MRQVRVYDDVRTLSASFERLFDEATAGSGIFCSIAWFRNLEAETSDCSGRIRMYAVEDAATGVPLLVLPMVCSAAAGRFLGGRRLHAAANCYTSLFQPVSADGNGVAPDQALFDCVINAMISDGGRCDAIDLHPLAVEHPSFDALLKALRSAGLKTDHYFCFGNWYLPVNQRSYREYCTTLPSRLRNTLKRKSKQLASAQRLRIDILDKAADVAEGARIFEGIYRASWKPPEQAPGFVPGLMRCCAEQGWLRLGIAYIDGQPAAAQLWIVCAGVASIYKLAYDERFAEYSVGSLLTAHLMEHVIDVDKVREVDYLTGDDPYKRDWMSHRRERRGIIAFNLRSPVGMLGALRHFGGRALKKIFYKTMPRPARA